MRISNQRKQEIVRAFQVSFKKDNSAEIENIDLRELRDTDEMLGDRDLNAGFRLALKNRIQELDMLERRRHESKIRALNICTGIIIGLVIAGFAKLLFG
jgi:hypothetical protein